MPKSIKVLIERITALEPCYGRRGGNAVRIYTRDGVIHEVEKSIKAALNSIAGYYSIDLKSARKNYGFYLNSSLNVPLPFSPKLLLVAVKTRCPKYQNDGATGYVNLHDVTGVEEIAGNREKEARCLIHLKGGRSLPCYLAYETTKQRQVNARLVEVRYLELHRQEKNSSSPQAVLESMDKTSWSRLDNEIVMFIMKDGSKE